jgi:hypothetical protein
MRPWWKGIKNIRKLRRKKSFVNIGTCWSLEDVTALELMTWGGGGIPYSIGWSWSDENEALVRKHLVSVGSCYILASSHDATDPQPNNMPSWTLCALKKCEEIHENVLHKHFIKCLMNVISWHYLVYLLGWTKVFPFLWKDCTICCRRRDTKPTCQKYRHSLTFFLSFGNYKKAAPKAAAAVNTKISGSLPALAQVRKKFQLSPLPPLQPSDTPGHSPPNRSGQVQRGFKRAKRCCNRNHRSRQVRRPGWVHRARQVRQDGRVHWASQVHRAGGKWVNWVDSGINLIGSLEVSLISLQKTHFSASSYSQNGKTWTRQNAKRLHKNKKVIFKFRWGALVIQKLCMMHRTLFNHLRYPK